VAALAGLAATWQTAPGAVTLPGSTSLGPRDYRGAGFASVVLSFLALVWLDSAAFAVIQQNAALRAPTWGGDARQWTMGLVHAAAAIAAGALIDRGVFRGLLLGAYALFVVAFGGLQHAGGIASDGLAAVGPLYAIGISIYSTALVAYPSLWPFERDLVPRRWRAAAVYGVAGWCGSALGVGMAQRLERIPVVFEAAAGALLLAAWVMPRLDGRRLARSYGVAAGGGAVAMAFLLVAPRQPAVGSTESVADAATLVERGRRVYVAEGCIHCHSQYVRPGSRDVEAWGPFRPVTGDERPPLLGNRRQGPDLRNVGDRRGAGWQELHLRDPRGTSPGSRMPSYAHLFAPGDPRGEELVAYLESLGVLGAVAAPQPHDTALARDFSSTRRGSASRVVGAGVPARGRALFGLYCATCHGVDGRGDGPLAAALGRKPAMDLRKGAPWLLSWGAGAPPLREELAKAIRWGIEGTNMPGHETLGDRDVADLAAWVEVMVEDEWIGGAVLASTPGEVRP
jgi:cytochrome c oxidase cbb3-type subunit 2